MKGTQTVLQVVVFVITDKGYWQCMSTCALPPLYPFSPLQMYFYKIIYIKQWTKRTVSLLNQNITYPLTVQYVHQKTIPTPQVYVGLLLVITSLLSLLFKEKDQVGCYGNILVHKLLGVCILWPNLENTMWKNPSSNTMETKMSCTLIAPFRL